MTEQPIDAQKLTKEIIETEAELRAMGNTPKSECNSPWEAVDKLEALSEQPKSECKCLDCNLPELETLSYKPTIAELEKAIRTGNELDILPNGQVQKKIPLTKKPIIHTIECVSKPEQSLKQPSSLETVDSFASSGTEQPPKSSSATKEEITPIIEPETKGKNSKVAGQPLEQPKMISRGEIDLGDGIKRIGEFIDEPQPNTELLIVKTIQGLTTCINNELEKVVVLRACMLGNERKVLISKALEEIDLFEKTTLFELQKAFE